MKANVTVILALYKDPDPKDYSPPTVIIASDKNEVRAAVVRTYYDKDLKKSVMVTTIKGPDRTSEFKAVEGLYSRSRAAMQRAINFSKNAEGFDFWEDLDL
jgi:acetyl esterase/lipase